MRNYRALLYQTPDSASTRGPSADIDANRPLKSLKLYCWHVNHGRGRGRAVQEGPTKTMATPGETKFVHCYRISADLCLQLLCQTAIRSKQVDLSFSPKNLSGQILQVLIFGKNVVNFFTCGFFAHTSDSGLILRLQDMSPQFFLKFAKQAPLFVIFFTPYAKECYFFTVGRFQ